MPNLLATLALTLVLGAPALAGPPALTTSLGHSIPADAGGVVVVENVRRASLLQLNGMTGTGEAVLRTSQGGCIRMPLRFAAGNFEGRGIGIRGVAPVVMALSDEVARDLLRGREVVSDGLTTTGPQADVRILSGLTPSYGFVLNPGLSIWAEVFGPGRDPIDCR